MNVLNLVTTSDSAHFQEQIRALDKNGVNNEIVATSGPESVVPEFMDYLSRTPIPNNGQQFLYYSATALSYYPKVLSKSIYANNYDLVHATSGFVAPVGVAQPKRPLVISFWGTDLLGNYWGGRYKYVCRYCAQKADAVIVMSEEMKNELGCDAYVIPHGIDLEKFSSISMLDARRKLGWDENHHYILFPYNPKRTVKRYPLAKEIVEEVNDQVDTDVSLVVLTGEPHWKVPIYMNAADVLLLTSKHEGSPNTVKEAMACNLPIVSTDVGDVRKRLQNSHSSNVCNSKQDLINGTIEAIERKGRSNDREQVQDLSLNHMGKQIRSVYEDVIDEYK